MPVGLRDLCVKGFSFANPDPFPEESGLKLNEAKRNF